MRWLPDLPSALGQDIDELILVAGGRRDRVTELLQLLLLLHRQRRHLVCARGLQIIKQLAMLVPCVHVIQTREESCLRSSCLTILF